MLEAVHPDVTWQPPPGPMGSPVFRGHDGVRQFLADWLEAWGAFQQEVLDVDMQGDWGVARVAVRTRGGASGIEIAAESGYLIRLQDGKLAYMRIFMSCQEALAARAEMLGS